MFDWPQDAIEKLQRLWKDGLSASAIARELGDGITRSAVIGKIHRLKLADTAPPKVAPVRRTPAPKPRADKVAARRTTATQGLAFKMKRAKDAGLSLEDGMSAVLGRDFVPNIGDTPDGRPLLRLEQLTDHTCKWPFGDPLEAGFGFCGAPSLEKAPYCAAHAARAYNSLASAR